ncbi:MAG: Hsp20/alpha crystallin family protein [Eubacteriales bacterium]|nr:Hsp20/alpha crystallin family protein [Eubacteriales bacterium]
MMLPSIFRNGFFDDFDDFMDWPTPNRTDTSLMKSDVKDAGDHYELMMDLPGFQKENVKLSLKEGVLTFEAQKNISNDENGEDGKYLRRERFQGTCTRSFYVGEHVQQKDIHAKFENGVLTVSIPKNQPKPQVEENKYIQIEG